MGDIDLEFYKLRKIRLSEVSYDRDETLVSLDTIAETGILPHFRASKSELFESSYTAQRSRTKIYSWF